MDLISLQFVVFLAVALVAYYAAGRFAPRFQWVVLLVASLVFYLIEGSPATLGIMAGIALVTWWAALKLGKLDDACTAERAGTKDRAEKKAIRARFATRKRRILIAALAICLLVLVYFKYANTVLFNFGLAPSKTSLGILLPLGISFYTFQSLGYLIDAYNGKVVPQTNYARHLLFVSWFPQIIQGPINTYKELGPQLVATRHADERGMRRGLLLLGYGILKKVAIANVLYGNVYNIFDHVDASVPGNVALAGVILYSIQMYADFSGGIDMVRGVSELFGIEMAVNFRQPYFSVSLADFWRRWHMSLGVWMRTYVFYPLAVTKPIKALGTWAKPRFGRHVGRTIGACVANIIVFLLVGLWHGAETHYIAWGLYNGVIVALADLLSPAFKGLGELVHYDVKKPLCRVWACVRTFFVVAFGRFFDCVPTLAASFACIHALVFNFAPLSLFDGLSTFGVTNADRLGLVGVTIVALAVVVWVSVMAERGHDVRSLIMSWHPAARIALYIAILFIVCFAVDFDTTGGGGFLYANF